MPSNPPAAATPVRDAPTTYTETRSMPETKITRWTCEKCGGTADVCYPADESVYGVVDLLRGSHHAVSPACEMDLTSIHVTEVPVSDAGEGGDPTNRARVSGVSDPYGKRLPASLVQPPNRRWEMEK